MDKTKELLFLLELRALTHMATDQAASLESTVAEWSKADDDLREPGSLPKVTGAFEDAVKQQNAQVAELQRRLDAKTQPQADFFERIDAFLALAGRIALILFPQQEAHNAVRRDRAAQLRAALGIDAGHVISDRKLRNKWTHFDEVLDDLGSLDGRTISPHRFISSEEVSDIHRRTTLRLFIVDQIRVEYLGIGAFGLRDMFAAIEDLRVRTLSAIEGWGSRWKEEFLREAQESASP